MTGELVTPLIDPTAEVHPTARVAPGAVVGAHAVIGPDCRLDPYAVVGPFTTLGPRCHVHAFAMVGGPAQDRRTDPDAPFRLECGADNVFREGATVSRGTAHGGGTTRLGRGNLLMAHSHVGHDARLGDGNTLANGVSLAGHVQVGDGVVFGGHVGVHQFARVGDLALLAANAMVSLDVPPFCIAAGDRARLRGLNTTGLRRAGFSPELRLELERAWRALFRRPGRLATAEALRAHPVEPVARLARFVLESPRGVTRASRT